MRTPYTVHGTPPSAKALVEVHGTPYTVHALALEDVPCTLTYAPALGGVPGSVYRVTCTVCDVTCASTNRPGPIRH